jgi:L-lactate dehydrogenase
MGEALPLSKKEMQKAYTKAKRAAYDVIALKGATFYAIALAVARIVRAILYDENHIFVSSVLLRGEYGIKDVCLSVPVVVGRSGVKKIIPITLSAEEKKRLQKSAEVMKENIKR